MAARRGISNVVYAQAMANAQVTQLQVADVVLSCLLLYLQDMMNSEQLQKLAELRKQRANAPQPSSNIVQV